MQNIASLSITFVLFNCGLAREQETKGKKQKTSDGLLGVSGMHSAGQKTGSNVE